MAGRRRVLLLGGTTEAYELAAALADLPDIDIVTSLAGRTADPRPPEGGLRTGGFGGVAGLEAVLRGEQVALLIDATHPFARRISEHAIAAARGAGVPLIRLERPPWRPGPGDDWHELPTLEEAIERVAGLASSVFATLGPSSLPLLAAAPGTHFIARCIEPPLSLPVNVVPILGRGPFEPDAEEKLLRSRRVGAILCRNSGGSGSVAKLVAARRLGLPVVMQARPPGAFEGAHILPDVASVLDALAQPGFFGRSTWV